MADSLRIQQLKNLAGSIPAANQKVAQGLQAAQDIQLKGGIRQMQPGMGPGAAQQLGAQSVQNKGQIALQTAQQTGKQTAQVGQLGLQQKGVEAQQQLGQQQRQVSGKQREYQDRLSALGSDLKNKLLDDQLQFRQDERGRAFLNDRQLADWTALNARNQEEFQNYQQTIEQAYSRKLQMLQQADNLLKQQLEQSFKTGEQGKNQEQQVKLAKMKRAMEKKIADEQAKAANRAGIFGAAGTIAGAVVGSMVAPGAGTAAGAMVGAQIGGGVGTMAAGATK